jgi:hypothetical protein
MLVMSRFEVQNREYEAMFPYIKIHTYSSEANQS